MNVRLRQAEDGEAEVLSVLAMASKARWNYPPDMLEAWRPALTVSADYVRSHLVRVLELEGRVVGFFAIVPAKNRLDHFWLRPEAIGLGLGRVMFAHASRLSREHGLRYLLIVSDPHAEGFYLRMGARRIGVEPSGPNRMLPVLRCEVPPAAD